MTSSMHKNTSEQLESETTITDRTSDVNRNSGNIQTLPVLDIKKIDYQE